VFNGFFEAVDGELVVSVEEEAVLLNGDVEFEFPD
jgi:hypothetical protein